jgi:hypothetical protein
MEDVIALDATRIAEYGFLIQGVVGPGGADDGVGSWVYTVGLLDAIAHPELIVAGVAPDSSAPLVSFLARAVLDGDRLEVDDTIDLGDTIIGVGSVHEIQYELDTFNMWQRQCDPGTPALGGTDHTARRLLVLAQGDARVEAAE